MSWFAPLVEAGASAINDEGEGGAGTGTLPNNLTATAGDITSKVSSGPVSFGGGSTTNIAVIGAIGIAVLVVILMIKR